VKKQPILKILVHIVKKTDIRKLQTCSPHLQIVAALPCTVQNNVLIMFSSNFD